MQTITQNVGSTTWLLKSTYVIYYVSPLKKFMYFYHSNKLIEFVYHEKIKQNTNFLHYFLEKSSSYL